VCCFHVNSAVQGIERIKKTVAILANVSKLCLKSNNYSGLGFFVCCKVRTLVSLDVSQNKLKVAEAKALAQDIKNWFVCSVICN
jgi:hypothetical protein